MIWYEHSLFFAALETARVRGTFPMQTRRPNVTRPSQISVISYILETFETL